jgi:hypothetical protein
MFLPSGEGQLCKTDLRGGGDMFYTVASTFSKGAHDYSIT